MSGKTSSIAKILPLMLGFYVMGFCDIVGISSDYAKEAFGWSNTMTGFIPSMVFIWFLFLGIPVGLKMNAWGRKNTVLLSMGLTVLGMALPLVRYTPFTCLTAYALLGIGNAILQVSLNPLLTNVVTNGKLLTSSLTGGQVVKALSSLSGPAIVLLAVKWFGGADNANWYLCFPVMGGITLVSALWLYLTPIRREESSSVGISFSEVAAVLKDKTILLIVGGIFFVVGLDVATNFISSKIMITRFGWAKEEAGLASQTYFFCRTVGAFLGVILMTKIADIRYFRINIVLCAASVLALAFLQNQTADLVAIGGIGFFASCVFSILFSVAMQKYPQKANIISGLMITAISGGAVVTPVIGLVADVTHGITGGVFVILFCVLYLAFCAFSKAVASKEMREAG